MDPVKMQHCHMVRGMRELTEGMHITFIGELRSYDYIITMVSRRGGFAQVVKQDDGRVQPRKMMLKGLPYFIKRGRVWAEDEQETA